MPPDHPDSNYRMAREALLANVPVPDQHIFRIPAELSDPAAYSSCVVADIGGVRTIVGFTAKAGVGVRASDGKLMWHYTKVANRTANIATPIVHENKVFYTSAYGTGAALLSLKNLCRE